MPIAYTLDTASSRRFAFNALPLNVRTRLVEQLKRPPEQGGPVRQLSTPVNPKSKEYLLFSILLAGALVWLGVLDFGRNDGPLQSWGWLLYGWLPLSWLFLRALLRHLLLRLRTRHLPVLPGSYLLALDYIELDEEYVKITPLSTYRDCKVTHVHRNGSYDHTDVMIRTETKRIPLRTSTKALAEAGANEWLERFRMALIAVAAITEDRGTQDHDTYREYLRSVDPFFELRAGSESWTSIIHPLDTAPREKTEPIFPPLPSFLSHRAHAALAGCLILGPFAWGVRNFASDTAAFREIKATGNLHSLDTYIETGFCHLKAARALRPRFALNEAEKKDTATAYRDFIQKFGKEAPGLAGEADQHMHRLYEEAKTRFLDQMKKPIPPLDSMAEDEIAASLRDAADDRSLIDSVTTLLAWAERTPTPLVPICFISAPPSDIKRSDSAIQAGLDQEGQKRLFVPMAPYFTVERTNKRERQFAQSLKACLAQIFPHDVLDFEYAAQAPAKESPCLIIAWKLIPSDTLYESEKHLITFGSFKIVFIGGFRAPGSPGQMGYRASNFQTIVAPPDKFYVEYKSDLGNQASNILGPDILGPDAGLVYDTMAQRAFDRAATRLCQAFHMLPAHVETQVAPR